MVSCSVLCCAGEVEYQEEERGGDGCAALDWLLGSRVAAGQKQFTQNMVKIFNESNTKTNI